MGIEGFVVAHWWQTWQLRYHVGLPPTQDASHHQDYEPFLVGNPELNLHLPLASWVGGRSKLSFC